MSNRNNLLSKETANIVVEHYQKQPISRIPTLTHKMFKVFHLTTNGTGKHRENSPQNTILPL